jgi:predicted nucleic acid-binding protein
MAFLLGINVVSELGRPRPHGAVLAWLQSVEDADLQLASVTIGEIQAGIELTREQDASKAGEIEMWLDQVSDSFNILTMDGPAFRCWAQLIPSIRGLGVKYWPTPLLVSRALRSSRPL